MEGRSEILRSKEEKRILTGKIIGIEDEYYKAKKEVITCAIIWYEETKVLIPISLLNVRVQNKRIIRGMIGAEVDFIGLEYDEQSNIAIASRKLAMEIRQEIEIPKLKVNDVVRVRIVTVARKYVVVDFYGREIQIFANNLKHTFIVNCKDKYRVGDYLIVRIKKIDKQIELSAKDMTENPYKNIRKYITEYGEYIGVVVGYPQKRSGIIVQLDNSEVTCLTRVSANFNNVPHLYDKVLIKITEINTDKKLVYGVLKRVFGGSSNGY